MDEFKSFNDFREEIHHVRKRNDPAPEWEEKEKDAEEKSVPRKSFSSKRDLQLYLGGAAAFLLCVAGVICFLPVPFGEIRLSGNQAMTLDAVLFDGKVAQPVNVWQISASELERRLSMDVRVEKARVSRAFPYYLDVEIVERRPIAVVQEEFGYAVLDREGVVLRTVAALRKTDLPVVTGIKMENLLLGDQTRDEGVGAALQFFGGLSAEGLREFSEINIGNKENVVAYTREGVPVWLGEGDRMPERAALAERMLKDMKNRKLSVEHIDASLTSPYFKMKA